MADTPIALGPVDDDLCAHVCTSCENWYSHGSKHKCVHPDKKSFGTCKDCTPKDLNLTSLSAAQILSTKADSTGLREIMEKISAINNEICSKWTIEPSINDYEYLKSCVERMQTACANVSMLLGATKEKLSVRDAEGYRAKTKEQKQAERDATRQQAEKQIESANHQAQLEAERKDPTLKLRRKQVESFMALGMSAADAESAVRSIEEKRRVQ